MTDIRPIRGGEDEAVIALWTACGLTRPWNDPVADLNLAKDAATSTVLVAADEAGISGTIIVGFDGHRGWVYYLAVDPDRRRGGLGRSLMAAAQDWLKDKGAPKLQLMVRTDNEAALGFYQRLGLERQDVVVLGRRLDG
jgi:ribosomal protein S18 acetylase RimI-like enzyme